MKISEIARQFNIPTYLSYIDYTKVIMDHPDIDLHNKKAIKAELRSFQDRRGIY